VNRFAALARALAAAYRRLAHERAAGYFEDDAARSRRPINPTTNH
jgi:hypothetical protein